jgi:NAD(P)H-dependent FMN reductase
MSHIAIISASIRPDRKSHRVALYFEKYLADNKLATTEILDLRAYNFPIFDDTLKKQKDPNPQTLEYAKKIDAAHGVIIVAPEYNGAMPASLKNAIDVLYDEWRHKPTGIVTVSEGPFAGNQCLVSLQFTLWKMKAWTITEMFSVPNISKTYSPEGVPKDKDSTDKLAQVFMKEMMWCIKADTSSKL